MIINIKNNATNEILSCSINSSTPADIAFQDITQFNERLHPENYKQFVLAVPFCQESAQIRAESKVFRSHYGVDKTYIMDIDETFPVNKKLKLSIKDPIPTLELAKQFFNSQNFSILEDDNASITM